MSGLGAAERAVLLAFADDEHLMGQRHTEWIGVAPFLEEDLAFSSIAQDELGHAAMLYELVLRGDQDGRHDPDVPDVDALAFGRPPGEYRSCWLVEAACVDWAEALVRHWLYDAAEELRWRELTPSSDASIAGAATRALHEEAYHVRHADALLDALAGDPQAQERIAAALQVLLPLGLGLFESPDGAAGADPQLVGAPLEALAGPWRERVERRFGPVDWSAQTAPPPAARTLRSAPFDEVYGRMREVLMLDPDAVW